MGPRLSHGSFLETSAESQGKVQEALFSQLLMIEDTLMFGGTTFIFSRPKAESEACWWLLPRNPADDGLSASRPR